jgi:hypothetical protein
VAYDCICEGWIEVEMTEDVYLHDRTAFQDVILKSRQQTDWRSDSLHMSVLRSVGKHLHLLNCTGEQSNCSNVRGKQFTELKCTGKRLLC